MNRCERTQMEFSALLDGQADSQALVGAVQHALSCADCKTEFARFAALQGLLPRLEPAQARRRLPRPDLRGLAAAALVLLALGIGWMSPHAAREAGEERAVEIALGAHPERMDEARFVAIAVELLQADPRYASSMRELLERVLPEHSEFTHEGTAREASVFAPEADGLSPQGQFFY